MVALRFASDRGPVRLRELTGYEERSISGTDTEHALRIIDALLLPAAGEASTPRAEDLVAADRDQVLAELYGQIYGDRIESTLACEGCAELFDIHFSLKQLLATVADRPRSMEIQAAGENLFETSAGWRFRLPTGRDEREAGAFGLPDSEGILLGRCMVNEAPCPDASAIQAALEELAPLVDLELRAQCPECGHIRFLQFDIQTYLLGSLVQDQTRLAFEIHRIAAAYGWCLNEILSLTRTERRRMVELIENEPAQPARAFR